MLLFLVFASLVGHVLLCLLPVFHLLLLSLVPLFTPSPDPATTGTVVLDIESPQPRTMEVPKPCAKVVPVTRVPFHKKLSDPEMVPVHRKVPDPKMVPVLEVVLVPEEVPVPESVPVPVPEYEYVTEFKWVYEFE